MIKYRAMKRNKGLTLIEVFIIVILVCILAAMAIPRLLTYFYEAKIAREKASVGSIRVGINNYYLQSVLKNRQPPYPLTLDMAANDYASPTNPLFTTVLASGVITREWRKLSNSQYQSEASGIIYTYDCLTGQFKESSTP